jgi:hypothetical protein
MPVRALFPPFFGRAERPTGMSTCARAGCPVHARLPCDFDKARACVRRRACAPMASRSAAWGAVTGQPVAPAGCAALRPHAPRLLRVRAGGRSWRHRSTTSVPGSSAHARANPPLSRPTPTSRRPRAAIIDCARPPRRHAPGRHAQAAREKSRAGGGPGRQRCCVRREPGRAADARRGPLNRDGCTGPRNRVAARPTARPPLGRLGRPVQPGGPDRS